MFMLNEPRLLYIPILKGSLLYDSHHLIHYLPDYTPSHVKDFSYNPSYQPQIFMKGLKSNLSTHGSMGRIMALSTCGEFVYIKKSINCIMRIDLQAKLNSRSNRAEKKSSYRMELHTDDFYIVDFRPLPGSEKLLILGNKCELRIYEFQKFNEGEYEAHLICSQEILKQRSASKKQSKDKLRFRTEYQDSISLKTEALLQLNLENSQTFKQVELQQLELFGCLGKKEQANLLEICPDGKYAVIGTTSFGSMYQNYQYQKSLLLVRIDSQTQSVRHRQIRTYKLRLCARKQFSKNDDKLFKSLCIPHYAKNCPIVYTLDQDEPFEVNSYRFDTESQSLVKFKESLKDYHEFQSSKLLRFGRKMFSVDGNGQLRILDLYKD